MRNRSADVLHARRVRQTVAGDLPEVRAPERAVIVVRRFHRVVGSIHAVTSLTIVKARFSGVRVLVVLRKRNRFRRVAHKVSSVNVAVGHANLERKMSCISVGIADFHYYVLYFESSDARTEHIRSPSDFAEREFDVDVLDGVNAAAARTEERIAAAFFARAHSRIGHAEVLNHGAVAELADKRHAPTVGTFGGNREVSDDVTSAVDYAVKCAAVSVGNFAGVLGAVVLEIEVGGKNKVTVVIIRAGNLFCNSSDFVIFGCRSERLGDHLGGHDVACLVGFNRHRDGFSHFALVGGKPCAVVGERAALGVERGENVRAHDGRAVYRAVEHNRFVLEGESGEVELNRAGTLAADSLHKHALFHRDFGAVSVYREFDGVIFVGGGKRRGALGDCREHTVFVGDVLLAVNLSPLERHVGLFVLLVHVNVDSRGE